MSTGCNKAPQAGDGANKWNKHNIMVTGVTFTKPATGGGSWTNRVYFLELPAGYDGTKSYPVIFGGGGCGGGIGTNGNGGGFTILGGNQANAIQIGLSYVWGQNEGACFEDGYTNTPDIPYFDSILAEVESNYCVDKGNVFVGGYSSGGWESYMLGLARGGVVRGIATAAGGLRSMADRPPPSGIPIAAILLTGPTDTTNPADGPTGSMAARDLILQTNGCQGTATTAWAPFAGCNQYTGCPAAYPVIYCRAGGDGHTDGGGGYKTAIWSFWSGLPARP